MAGKVEEIGNRIVDGDETLKLAFAKVFQAALVGLWRVPVAVDRDYVRLPEPMLQPVGFDEERIDETAP